MLYGDGVDEGEGNDGHRVGVVGANSERSSSAVVVAG